MNRYLPTRVNVSIRINPFIMKKKVRLNVLASCFIERYGQSHDYLGYHFDEQADSMLNIDQSPKQTFLWNGILKLQNHWIGLVKSLFYLKS